MQQPIVGFHQDDDGHWVADLACGHGQHVRHDPPWQVREWVLEDSTRRARLGSPLECVRCDTYADARMRGLCPEGALEASRADPSAPSSPRVGVAVIVRRDTRVLLGRRLSATHGAGTWQFPGGHLEMFEDLETCGAR